MGTVPTPKHASKPTTAPSVLTQAKPMSSIPQSPEIVQPSLQPSTQPSLWTRAVADARSIVRLGAPLMVNNLAFAGMAFADTVMTGQLGATALAGLLIGNACFQLAIFTGMGILLALSPAVAHAYGAGDESRIVRYVRQSWWLSLGLSCVMM